MRAWVLFLIGIISFSLVGTLKSFAGGWPTELLAFARLAGAAILFRFVFFRGELAPIKKPKVWIEFTLIGILLALAFTLYLESFESIKISDVKLLGFVDPVLVLLFAGALLGEKVGKKAIGALVLSTIGLAAMWIPLSGEPSALDGLIIAVLAMVCGAASTILIRKSEVDAPLSEVLVYPFSIGAGILLIWMLLHGVDFGLADMSLWPYIALLATTTAIGYYAYDEAMSELGAHLADLALRVGITLFGAFFAVIFVGESVSFHWYIAAVFLLGSSLLLYWEAKDLNKPYVHKVHGHTH